MSILEHLQQVCDRLQHGEFSSEAMVSQGILLPALQALGWPVFDTQVCIPQYPLASHLVDFALCHPAKHPNILIKVKQVNGLEKRDHQLLQNASYNGVPMVIFTNGSRWSFYLPNEQDSDDQCCLYQFNLLESNLETVVDHLTRYLQYQRVCSKKALETAYADYQNLARDRQILATLPQAWQALLSEPDDLLIDLLSDKTRSLCGHYPDADTCHQFLKKICNSSEKAQPVVIHQSNHNHPQVHDGEFWVKFQGEFYPARNGREVMLTVFQLLAKHDREFLERFAAKKHGHKRRYIARDQTDLYPGRPDFIKGNCEQIVPGWWLGTHYSHRRMNEIIKMALEVTVSPLKKTLEWRIG